MAHLQRRGAKWQARYRGPDGRERAKRFDRKVDAQRWLDTQGADKARGAWVDPALGRTTFGAWAEEWLGLQVALKPKTRVGYEGILRRHLLPRFGTVQLAVIEPVEVRRYVAELEAAGLSPLTVRNIYRTLSAIMRSAAANRRIQSNPCVDVALPRARTREMVVLTADHVEHLADVAGPEHGPLLLLAAYSGMRWGEIAALRVGRLNLLRGTVDVVESATEVAGGVQFVSPKNGRTRTIRLPRSVLDTLTPITAGKGPGELVFAAARGGPLLHGPFYVRVFRPAVARAGLDTRLRFHDLRHTCAALLIAQGAHPRAIMERLGHSSITVTMDVYGHLLPSIDEALAAGLEATILQARADKARTGDGQVIGLTG